MKALAAVFGLAMSVSAFGQVVPPAVTAAEKTIDSEKIRAHVKFLADDALEGRGPGLRGADIAAKYIATEFALDGLKPAGDNGTFFQQVNFVGVKTVREKTNVSVGAMTLKFGEEFVTSNQTHTPSAEIDAPVVFVGYGVTAPEYGWDDYKGIDVKGKVVMLIVGDPPSDDPNFFKGKAMTYYGRWTYKFEQAARMGAVGALIIHRTDLASYGWGVVEHSWSGEKTYLRDDHNPALQLASWIQLGVAGRIFAAAGKNADANVEIAEAGKKGFKAYELPLRVKGHVESVIRPFESPNVVAKIVGTGTGKDQALLYSAHYDHLGFVPGMDGDNIYNGAVDNGTGCDILLEMARAWGAMGMKPAHTVIFAAVTAEEQGLLGSEYLGQHPPVPAGEISLNLNYDGLQPIAGPLEVQVAGAERTTFYPTLVATAKRWGLGIVPEAHPEAGGYYRSDHFSMARIGVPAFSIDPGDLYAGHDKAWGVKQGEDYNEHRYHDFSDNYTESMDFTGLAKMARFGMELGWEALAAKGSVGWQAGDEFEAARKASLTK